MGLLLCSLEAPGPEARRPTTPVTVVSGIRHDPEYLRRRSKAPGCPAWQEDQVAEPVYGLATWTPLDPGEIAARLKFHAADSRYP